MVVSFWEHSRDFPFSIPNYIIWYWCIILQWTVICEELHNRGLYSNVPHILYMQPQSQKIHEILRLKLTDKSSPEKFRDYRLFIKSRLNAPYKVSTRLAWMLYNDIGCDYLVKCVSAIGSCNLSHGIDNTDMIFRTK